MTCQRPLGAATMLTRRNQRVSEPCNKRDLDEGWGYQNRITDLEKFHRWFYQDSCSGSPIKILLP
jgi:hypothetical protein